MFCRICEHDCFLCVLTNCFMRVGRHMSNICLYLNFYCKPMWHFKWDSYLSVIILSIVLDIPRRKKIRHRGIYEQRLRNPSILLIHFRIHLTSRGSWACRSPSQLSSDRRRSTPRIACQPIAGHTQTDNHSHSRSHQGKI